jgi:hypothetical protein
MGWPVRNSYLVKTVHQTPQFDMRNRTLRLVLISFAVMVCGFSLVVGCYGWYLRLAAKHLRDDLVLLSESATGHSDLLRVADNYARFRVPAASKYCRGPNDSCVVEFEISNKLLSRIHLSKPSLFGARVIELNNRIAYIEMGLHGVEQARGVSAQTTYVIPDTPVAEIFDLSSRPPYSFAEPFGKPYMRTIVTNSASSEQKTKATAFDMGCLTSFRGCNWPCDYLPLAWRDYRNVLPEDIKHPESKCAW